MTTIAYTAIYGGYDRLKAHPDHPLIDEWMCFTDNPGIVHDGWTTVVEPARFPHPRLSAKWRKCHPPEADRTIWLDGSILLSAASFIDVVCAGLDTGDMVMFPHPERVSLIAEADVSAAMVKYHRLPVHTQARHYIADWHWPDNELWASTTIGRNHTPPVLQAGAAWFAENEHWTYQDQLSLPPILARYGINVTPLPYSLWANPWFVLIGHASDQ
jgi:hypothetical protein